MILIENLRKKAGCDANCQLSVGEITYRHNGNHGSWPGEVEGGVTVLVDALRAEHVRVEPPESITADDIDAALGDLGIYAPPVRKRRGSRLKGAR